GWPRDWSSDVCSSDLIALLDTKSQEIRVEVSTGLSDAGRFARYRLGEGITGRVVETGKPIVVPKVSREPMFLNRAGKRNLNKQEDRKRSCREKVQKRE